MSVLLAALQTTREVWTRSRPAAGYTDAMGELARFAEYKKTEKRSYVLERQELAGLYSNIQTKVKTYGLQPWEPRDGLKLEVRVQRRRGGAEADESQDLEKQWAMYMQAEATRSRAINARIREIKEVLRKEFAKAAEDFVVKLQRVEQAIGALQGSLQVGQLDCTKGHDLLILGVRTKSNACWLSLNRYPLCETPSLSTSQLPIRAVSRPRWRRTTTRCSRTTICCMSWSWRRAESARRWLLLRTRWYLPRTPT